MIRIDDLLTSTDTLSARIDELRLGAIKDAIIQTARPALKLVPGSDAARSFFGSPQHAPQLAGSSGRPVEHLLWLYLPEAVSALGQRLDELPGLDGMPSEGWLAFGAQLDNELERGEGFPYNNGTAVVRHFDGALDARPRADDFGGAFQHVGLEPILTVPDPEIAEQTLDLPAELLESYTTLWEPQTGTTPGPDAPVHALHFVFGHAGWLYSSGLPNPGEPPMELLAQIAPGDAVGASELRDRLLYFTCEHGHPLETLRVLVQR